MLKEDEELFNRLNSFHAQGSPGAKKLIAEGYLTEGYVLTDKAINFLRRFSAELILNGLENDVDPSYLRDESKGSFRLGLKYLKDKGLIDFDEVADRNSLSYWEPKNIRLIKR